jgi:hypothetical protein
MKGKPKELPSVPTPDCYICGRGGTTLKYLGLDVYRHEDCAPGTRMWAEWYDANPMRHTDAGNILRSMVK